MLELSWSRARTWRRCHKLHDYKYNQRLQRKARKAPLFKGSILHEMLDARATKQDPYAVLEKYAKEYKKLFLEQREEYGDLIDDLRRIFDAYIREYAAEKVVYTASELFIATDLGHDLRFIGYIDKIPEYQGRLWVMDHKTGRSIPDEDSRFSDLQLVFYNWAHNRERPSTKTSGVIWDYLRTKPPTIPEQLKDGGLSQRSNIDTDYHTYLAEIKRLELDPADYSKILVPLKAQVSPFFKRVVLPSPPEVMVNQVIEELVVTGREIQHLGECSTTRTMTRECKSCEMYSICHTELRGQDSDFVRKAEYQIKEPSDRQDESSEAETA